MSNALSFDILAGLLPVGVNPAVFASLPSTSTYLREQVKLGAPELTLVVAASQTMGRGRFGRDFFSPPDTGVYFSILLRPAPEKDMGSWLTVAAALASAEACEAIFGVTAEIKWVNDVLVDGRKAVGILAEAFENRLILGIGANILAPDGGFPKELSNAGAFTTSTVAHSRERFVAETVTRLLGFLDGSDRKKILEAYRGRVNMTGQIVTVTKGAEKFSATVLGIDDNAHLIVARGNGIIEHLSYGEVSLHNENV